MSDGTPASRQEGVGVHSSARASLLDLPLRTCVNLTLRNFELHFEFIVFFQNSFVDFFYKTMNLSREYRPFEHLDEEKVLLFSLGFPASA